jgi:hypothetical protein
MSASARPDSGGAGAACGTDEPRPACRPRRGALRAWVPPRGGLSRGGAGPGAGHSPSRCERAGCGRGVGMVRCYVRGGAACVARARRAGPVRRAGAQAGRGPGQGQSRRVQAEPYRRRSPALPPRPPLTRRRARAGQNPHRARSLLAGTRWPGRITRRTCPAWPRSWCRRRLWRSAETGPARPPARCCPAGASTRTNRARKLRSPRDL